MPPPPLLRKAWEAERWGLPEAGGTLDQPAGLLAKFGVILNDYNACRAYRQALYRYNDPKDLAHWEAKNEPAMKLVTELMRMRDDRRS